MKKSKVVVFGSFVMDLMARGPHLPRPAESVKGTMFQMGPGGKGFNQCVAAHKAGAEVTMVTKLGRDSFANVALDTMKELNMSSEHILYTDQVSTATALVVVDENTAQNQIMVIPGSLNTITADEVAGIESLIKEAEYLLIQLEGNQDANELVVDMAEKYGCKVIMNLAPYSPVSDAFLAKAYMVTPNEVEAEGMTGIVVSDTESAKKAADILREKGIEIVVITLGSRGAFISTKDRAELVPAFKVNAQDTTGAGDAFNGGLLAALSEGKDIWEAARFASALAALSVQKKGAAVSMPWRKEIEDFLAAQK